MNKDSDTGVYDSFADLGTVKSAMYSLNSCLALALITPKDIASRWNIL